MTTAIQSPAAARDAAGLPGIQRDIVATDNAQAELFLSVLHEGRGPKGWTDLRCKPIGASDFRRAMHLDPLEAAQRAVKLAPYSDVYIGVLPRTNSQAGGRSDLVDRSYWVWAECDTYMSVDRALEGSYPPQLVVRSSPNKAHCYWALRTPLPLEFLHRANRRLAWHLGADPASCDPARILRVPGTRNHKRGVPERVSIVRFDTGPNILPSTLVGDLPDPTPPRPMPALRVPRAPRVPGADPELDRLGAIDSRDYVYALTQREAYHNMVTCPFHGGGDERTPSFHVAGGDGTLWHCFGCDEGGDLFTFAAKLWGMDERRDFPALKKRLTEALR